MAGLWPELQGLVEAVYYAEEKEIRQCECRKGVDKLACNTSIRAKPLRQSWRLVTVSGVAEP